MVSGMKLPRERLGRNSDPPERMAPVLERLFKGG